LLLLEGPYRRCLSLEGNLHRHRRICVVVVPHPVTSLWPPWGGERARSLWKGSPTPQKLAPRSRPWPGWS
jgi:hypothetical protein